MDTHWLGKIRSRDIALILWVLLYSTQICASPAGTPAENQNTTNPVPEPGMAEQPDEDTNLEYNNHSSAIRIHGSDQAIGTCIASDVHLKAEGIGSVNLVITGSSP